jgi:HrpA-like RNA helicase
VYVHTYVHRYVVDAGKVKEMQYDAERGLAMLVETWVSRASATQRRGRAGRVRPGVAFKLYSRTRFHEHMSAHQLPEMQRTPLEHICLQIRMLKVGRVRCVKSSVVQEVV